MKALKLRSRANPSRTTGDLDTGNDQRRSVTRWRQLFSLTLSLVVLSAASSTSANTVLQLQTHYDDHIVSESYSHDLDVLFADLQTARDANLNGANRSHWRHGITIADVGTTVYSDYDQDGFYTHFSVSFDVDVGYGEAWVYAKIYLRDSNSEYSLFHTTEVFEIYDNLGTDRYKVESKLVSNYPADYYDVRIEVFEAGDSRVRDVVDASTHRTLFALPLESDILDDGPRDEIIHGSVGSTTLAGLSVLGLFVLRRRVIRLVTR